MGLGENVFEFFGDILLLVVGWDEDAHSGLLNQMVLRPQPTPVDKTKAQDYGIRHWREKEEK